MTSLATADTAPAPLNKLPSLTGLRWIAAMLVFGFHVGTLHIVTEPGYRHAVDRLFTLGLSGVQFFFILSGFVLVWSARPGDTRLAFWRRRVAKIYPNHLVMWAVVILLGLYWAVPQHPGAVPANLFLVQAWIPKPGWFYSVNTVSWSLSCELFFYLCLPLVLPVIRRARPWMLYAIVIAMPLLILSLWPAQTLLAETHRWWFTQIFPPVRSLEFWMGVAAAELMVRGKWRGPGLWPSSVIFLGTWVVATQWIRAELWTTLLAAVYVLVIAGAARADIDGAPSPWRSRPMVWLGEVSFAYYLVHVVVITTTLRFIDRRHTGFPGWRGPAAVFGFLLLSLLVAGLLLHLVERPMVRLLGPRRRTPRPPAVSPEAGAEAVTGAAGTRRRTAAPPDRAPRPADDERTGPGQVREPDRVG